MPKTVERKRKDTPMAKRKTLREKDKGYIATYIKHRDADQDAAANRAAEQEYRAQMQVEALLSQGKDATFFLQHQANTMGGKLFTGVTDSLSEVTGPDVLPEEEISFILGAAAKISEKKRAMYAGTDPDENFIESAKFAGRLCRGLPTDDPRRSTATLIGVKLARVMNLGLSGDAEYFESIEDTLVDLVNYFALLIRQQKRAARGNR